MDAKELRSKFTKVRRNIARLKTVQREQQVAAGSGSKK
jgi:ribosomal protein L29